MPYLFKISILGVAIILLKYLKAKGYHFILDHLLRSSVDLVRICLHAGYITTIIKLCIDGFQKSNS